MYDQVTGERWDEVQEFLRNEDGSSKVTGRVAIVFENLCDSESMKKCGGLKEFGVKSRGNTTAIFFVAQSQFHIPPQLRSIASIHIYTHNDYHAIHSDFARRSAKKVFGDIVPHLTTGHAIIYDRFHSPLNEGEGIQGIFRDEHFKLQLYKQHQLISPAPSVECRNPSAFALDKNTVISCSSVSLRQDNSIPTFCLQSPRGKNLPMPFEFVQKFQPASVGEIDLAMDTLVQAEFTQGIDYVFMLKEFAKARKMIVVFKSLRARHRVTKTYQATVTIFGGHHFRAFRDEGDNDEEANQQVAFRAILAIHPKPEEEEPILPDF
jgi:hypothetical protein